MKKYLSLAPVTKVSGVLVWGVGLGHCYRRVTLIDLAGRNSPSQYIKKIADRLAECEANEEGSGRLQPR